MLKFSTQDIVKAIPFELDGVVYKLDLTDQTPFIEFASLAKDLEALPEFETEGTETFVAKARELQTRANSFIDAALGEGASEKIIGIGKLRLPLVVHVLNCINQVYQSDEAQEIIKDMVKASVNTTEQASRAQKTE